MANKTLPLFDTALLWPAIADAFRKLNPRVQLHNPVMLVVYVGSIFTTLLTIVQFDGFTLGITLWQLLSGLSTPLKKAPTTPLTLLQKRWLKDGAKPRPKASAA